MSSRMLIVATEASTYKRAGTKAPPDAAVTLSTWLHCSPTRLSSSQLAGGVSKYSLSSSILSAAASILSSILSLAAPAFSAALAAAFRAAALAS